MKRAPHGVCRYMWRLTGREEYREWGWTVFSAFRRWCRTRSGYTSLEARDPGNSLGFHVEG